MSTTSPGGVEAVVDGVPVLVHVPAPGRGNGRLAVWVPFLGGAKETFAPVLERLAAAGFVAVGIDPRRHGARATDAPGTLAGEVMAGFRRVMWPILGGTALDVVEVIGWAVDRYRLTPAGVVVGGMSMGGDIAIAVAGVDPRIERVAAIAATPDWTRPGMTRVGEPDTVIQQGEPSVYGRWLYDRLDPWTHPERYDGRALAIRFDVGAADTHVPPSGAHRFATALNEQHPTHHVDVVVHDGLDHIDVVTDATILHAATDWLSTPAQL